MKSFIYNLNNLIFLIKLLIFISVLALITSKDIYAQVKVSIEKRTLVLGESVDLTIQTTGMSQGNIVPPDVEGLDFNVVSNSKSQTIINGQVSAKNIIVMRITPKNAGVYQVPKMIISVDGKNKQTQSFTLTVTKPKQLTNEQIKSQTPKYFIKRSINKNDVYVKQPIIETIELYSRVPLQSIARFGEDNTLVKIVELDKPTQNKAQIGDKTYDVITIKRVIIPLKSGEKIDSGSFGIEITYQSASQNSNNSFFGFSFSSSAKKRLSSKPAEFNVKSLPFEGVPDDFSGFVGKDITISARLSEPSIAMNESITFDLSFSGGGWMSSLKAQEPDFLKDFKVYPDKPELDQKTDMTYGLSGTKSFNYVVIPLKAGEYDLGSYEWSYFDTQLNSYKTVIVDMGTLISKNDNYQDSMLTNDPQDNISSVYADSSDDHKNAKDVTKADDRSIELLSNFYPTILKNKYQRVFFSESFKNIYTIIYLFLTFLMLVCLIYIFFVQKRQNAVEKWGSKQFVAALLNELQKANKSKNSQLIYDTLVKYFFANRDVKLSVSASDLIDKLETLNITAKDLQLWQGFINKLESDRYYQSSDVDNKDDVNHDNNWQDISEMILRLASKKTFS